jgi:hypothetical protein
MAVTRGGNIGIGTTSPGSKLQVIAADTTAISIRSNNASQYSILSVGRTSSDIIMASAASSGQFWVGSVAGDGWVGATNGTLSLGNDTTGTANLTIKGGNVGIGSVSPAYALDVIGTGRFTAIIETSTRTLKSNIESYSTDINKFKQLEPVSFTWKDTSKQDVGLIAEDVEQIFPEFVSKTDEGEVTGINYGKLTTVLINVLKQQQERIEKLEKLIK